MHRSHSQTGGWNILLAALGGGEGRGEVGEPPVSNSRYPPPPPGAATPGPSLSPRKRAERGKGSRLNRYRPNMWACPSRRPGREGSPRTAGPAGNFGGRGADVRSAAPPTSPSHASGVGPSLSPRKGGEGFSAGFCR